MTPRLKVSIGYKYGQRKVLKIKIVKKEKGPHFPRGFDGVHLWF